MLAATELPARNRMYSDNRLRLGFFGANCSSGRYMTTLPERWSASWSDCLRLARLADDAGIEFLLPIARWKGYGGRTDYQGAAWETIAWATGLLAATKRITVFGTVHAPLFHPLIAAKQMVTADHVGHGRFGLNIVCGWNEGEFAMFGVRPGDHEARYRQGQEWLDVVRRAWRENDFDHAGEFFALRGVRENPKPFGGTLPLTMNAGASADGRAFALRNCDAWFTQVHVGSGHVADVAEAGAAIRAAKDEGRRNGREIDVYTVGVVACKPTRKEAEEFYQYVTVENVDLAAVDNLLAWRHRVPTSSEDREQLRRGQSSGGGFKLIGSPDDIAERLAAVSAAGFSGIGLSFLNYADEFPFFHSEVLGRLERLGLRKRTT